MVTESRQRTRLARLWRRGQVGWPRSYPVAQFPNAPLLVALAGRGVAAVADGTARDVGETVFVLGLAWWAGGELRNGVNGFRRVLGAAGLVWIIARVAGEL